MDPEKVYDRGFHQGHKCGYIDAVGEIWDYIKDMPASDIRYAYVADLVAFLQERRERVLEHAAT